MALVVGLIYFKKKQFVNFLLQFWSGKREKTRAIGSIVIDWVLRL